MSDKEWDDLVDPARIALEALITSGDSMADRIKELEAELAKAMEVVKAADALANALDAEDMAAGKDVFEKLDAVEFTYKELGAYRDIRALIEKDKTDE
jgi:predicted ATP-dependent protease